MTISSLLLIKTLLPVFQIKNKVKRKKSLPSKGTNLYRQSQDFQYKYATRKRKRPHLSSSSSSTSSDSEYTSSSSSSSPSDRKMRKKRARQKSPSTRKFSVNRDIFHPNICRRETSYCRTFSDSH